MGEKRTGFIAPMDKVGGEYIINNVKYSVRVKFPNTIKADMLRDKIEKYIKSDFTHLTNHDDNDKLVDKHVC